VIFTAAGASNSGVFDAAEEKKKLAIGCDSNQDHIKPGFILTSMLKRVDIAVFDAIKEASQNQFKAGIIRYGLKEKGIDYSIDQYNEKILDAALIKKANVLRDQIISGKITVPDYYKRKK
jgi:basic membrane protein A